MTTLELKNKVIGKLNEINDDLILEEVYRLLENNDDDSSLFMLSDNHKSAIEEAKSQIANGEYFTDDQANEEINKWLRK